MKDIRITFTDGEFKKIKRVKDLTDTNWHDFILMLVIKSEEENRKR